MDDIDMLIEAVRALYTHLEELRSIAGSELQVPGSIDQYQSLLEDTYAVYDRVETTIEELGQALEYEHARLEQAVKQFGDVSK
jgi:hypothetical protein